MPKADKAQRADCRFAVIGGSGAHSLLTGKLLVRERLGPVETPFGPSQPLFLVEGDGAEFLFLPRHGETGYEVAAPWVNYRANIYALKDRGAERIVSWSGPGAIDPSLEIGQFVLPDDLLDETRGRETSFYKGTGLGFLRQRPVFCEDLRQHVSDCLKSLHLPFRAYGVYACTQGPRLETAAEIRKFAACRASLVGMTLAPEVFLAGELEMCYTPICYTTNYAEGVADRPPQPDMLFEGLTSPDEQAKVETAVGRFPEIIAALASDLRGAPRACRCSQAMARYRKAGLIGPDWRTRLGRV